MQQSNGTVVANISGSVTTSVPALPAGATLIVRSIAVSGVASQTIYTVTAGKTLYIQSVTLGTVISPTADTPTAQVEFDDGTAYRILCVAKISATATYPASGNNNATFPVPVPVAATKIVRVTTNSANQAATGTICGWEV